MLNHSYIPLRIQKVSAFSKLFFPRCTGYWYIWYFGDFGDLWNMRSINTVGDSKDHKKTWIVQVLKQEAKLVVSMKHLLVLFVTEEPEGGTDFLTQIEQT